MQFKKFGFGLLASLLALSSLTGAFADQLNVNAQTGTTYTFVNSDCSKLVTFSNAAAIAATLPRASSATGGGAASGNFMPPCVITVLDIGAGALTITPDTSTIGGASTLVLQTAQGAAIVSDGTNYQANLGGAGALGAAWLANGSVSVNFATGSFGPTGAHATVQEWISFKDASGVTRYIPAF